MPRHSIQEYLSVPVTWPVKEKIKHEIVLMPNARDIKTAKRMNPRACALHNAACRTYDIPNCAIGGRWAYIPQRDAKGNFYIARMQATAETQRAIRVFDKTGTMPKGGFRFIPVAKSHRYAAKKIINEKYRAEGPRKLWKVPKRKAKLNKALRAIPRALNG